MSAKRLQEIRQARFPLYKIREDGKEYLHTLIERMLEGHISPDEFYVLADPYGVELMELEHQQVIAPRYMQTDEYKMLQGTL